MNAVVYLADEIAPGRWQAVELTNGLLTWSAVRGDQIEAMDAARCHAPAELEEVAA